MAMLEISDIDSWKNFFDLIFDSSTIIELKLDQEKCKITLLNNSHVAFYDAEYDREFFDTYEVDGAESILVYVEDFYKILKSASKDDTLILESYDDILKIIFEHDMNRRVFEIPLGEDYSTIPPMPDIGYNGSCTVLLKELQKPCNDLDKIIKTNKFTCNVHDGHMHITSPKDSMTQYEQIFDTDEDFTGQVIVDVAYIQQVLKLSKIDKVVELYLGDGVPLKWKVVSPMEDVSISGLIAPIIEEEG